MTALENGRCWLGLGSNPGGSVSDVSGHIGFLTGLLGDFINRHTLLPARHAATWVWKVGDKIGRAR